VFQASSPKSSNLIRLPGVSGTGVFQGLKGAGTRHIKFANPTDRLFILDGKLAPAQP
jgi:hypothetical protein